MVHVAEAADLPFSVEDVIKVFFFSSCSVSVDVDDKSTSAVQFDTGESVLWIHSIDFKGSLLTPTGNHYLLTVTDEFSHFPFAFPCAQYISCNSDQVSDPICLERWLSSSLLLCPLKLRIFLHSHRILAAWTTPFSPQKNDQCEPSNRVTWKAVFLILSCRHLPITE